MSSQNDKLLRTIDKEVLCGKLGVSQHHHASASDIVHVTDSYISTGIIGVFYVDLQFGVTSHKSRSKYFTHSAQRVCDWIGGKIT